MHGSGVAGCNILRSSALFLTGVLAVADAGRAAAEFSSPTQLTVSGGLATKSSLSLDPANNAYIASVSADMLRVDLIGPDLRLSSEWDGEGKTRKDPNIVSNAIGQTFVCFSQLEADGSHDIYWTHNNGGRFIAPERVSATPDDERLPRLALDLNGEPHLVWIRKLAGDGTDRVYYHHIRSGWTAQVSQGRSASLAVDEQDYAHIALVSGDRVYYLNNRQGFFGVRELAAVASSPEGMDVRLLLDRQGNISIFYTSEGALYLVTRAAGETTFSPPRFLDAGDIHEVSVHLRRGEVTTIVYTKNGDLYFIQGVGDTLGSPELIGEATEAIEHHPSAMVDSFGNLHVTFVREGEVFYTNNAGDVQADFAASVRTGRVPLTVTFQSLSSGEIQRHRWDFGDGSGSAGSRPTHTYMVPGKYTVTLSVHNADRESTAVKADFITVQEPSNTLRIPNQTVLPGQKDVWFPVLAGHREPMQGFQVHARFDPRVLTLKECTQEMTVVQALAPDVWECNIGEGKVELGVVFELEKPFDNRLLRAGNNQTLVNLIFDVSNRAPQNTVTEIQLVNNRDLSSIFNIFAINSRSQFPILTSSNVTIHPVEFPLPKFFLRGDADNNGTIDITDAIRTLNFLFLGATSPPCIDAADVTDKGQVDITSAIYLLQYLFTGGSAPAVPFPNRGIDPTEDDLPPCSI